MKIESFELRDDGRVPNHPSYPLLLYRGAIVDSKTAPNAEDVIAMFAANGWRGAWVNGIYPFHHYHARSHEVLANIGEPVHVQFGGAEGPEVTFGTGDVVAIPAGGGHCRLSNGAGLVVIGAYPIGQEDWDLKRDTPADYDQAQKEISQVARPLSDPVTGQTSPLLDYWA